MKIQNLKIVKNPIKEEKVCKQKKRNQSKKSKHKNR